MRWDRAVQQSVRHLLPKLAPLINRGDAVVLTTSIANVKGMPGPIDTPILGKMFPEKDERSSG